MRGGLGGSGPCGCEVDTGCDEGVDGNLGGGMGSRFLVRRMCTCVGMHIYL